MLQLYLFHVKSIYYGGSVWYKINIQNHNVVHFASLSNSSCVNVNSRYGMKGFCLYHICSCNKPYLFMLYNSIVFGLYIGYTAFCSTALFEINMDLKYIELRQKFLGLPEQLKEKQLEIISKLSENTNVLAVLLTGYGKSLAFLIPPLMQDGICIVISPLRALIANHIQWARNMDVKAVALTSEHEMSAEDVESK